MEMLIHKTSQTIHIPLREIHDNKNVTVPATSLYQKNLISRISTQPRKKVSNQPNPRKSCNFPTRPNPTHGRTQPKSNSGCTIPNFLDRDQCYGHVSGRDRNCGLQIEVETGILALRPSHNVRSREGDGDRDVSRDQRCADNGHYYTAERE